MAGIEGIDGFNPMELVSQLVGGAGGSQERTPSQGQTIGTEAAGAMGKVATQAGNELLKAGLTAACPEAAIPMALFGGKIGL